MKKAFKRRAYESDSDSEIESYSNRGNKLKKRARFAHKGQLVPNDGPSSYREYVEYGGVRYPIIYRNPPLIDDEGYEIDSDDDDERVGEAVAFATQVNPYSNVHLEHILAPLTSATGLPSHPTLSKPFISKTLNKLVDQSCDNMRKENHSLWQVRHLLTALCGDHTWVPCEMMVRPSDVDLYRDDHVARHLLSLSQGHTGEPIEALPVIALNNGAHGLDESALRHLSNALENARRSDTSVTEDADISMADADPVDPNGTQSASEKPESNQNKHVNGIDATPTLKKEEGDARTEPEGDSKDKSDDVEMTVDQKKDGDKDPAAASALQNGEGDAAADGDAPRVVNGDLVGPAIAALEESFVHPMFIAPPGTKPERDVGLPEREAEDIRRLLALYVQKQEEVCRGAKKLYLGLLRAEKLRKEVWHWSKAEAHSGPNRDMSDGEDWYDKEEWGLTEDLKKGQDEEEEDTQTTGKKTRNRRT